MDKNILEKQIELQKASQKADKYLSPEEVDELHKFSNLGICSISDDDPEIYDPEIFEAHYY